MKKFFTYFFTTLGVIFFILLWGLAYVWFADPFGIRPLLQAITSDTQESAVVEPVGEDSSIPETGTKSNAPTSSGTSLTPEQKAALSTIGINPDALPELTPEMESCFIATLGSARVAEIKAGASPSPKEIFASRSCYE